MRLFANKLCAMAAPEAVSLTDLPDELLALISARLAGHDYAFCALRRTCRALSRLDFDNYALAALAALDAGAFRISERHQILYLLENVIYWAVQTRRRAVLAAMLTVENVGTAKFIIVRAAMRCNATDLFAEFPFMRTHYALKLSAVEYGRLETVKVLYAESKSALDRNDMCSMAASYGHVELCAYFYEIKGDALFHDDFVRRAISSNSIPLCEFIAGHAGLAVISNMWSVIIEVCAKGMTAAMLNWLGNHGGRLHIQKHAFLLACKAVRTNNVGVLAYLERFGIDRILGKTKDAEEISRRKWKLSRGAAKHGACDAFAWLNAHGLLTEQPATVAPFAAQYGRVRVLDWLVTKGLGENEFYGGALEEAADAGRLDVLNWARRRFNVPRAMFAKYAGRHETTDAFIASLGAK